MTPKQKANELYNYYDDLLNKYYENPIVNDNQLKQCALKSVDELIIEKNKWENGSFYTSKYWDYVKQEIEKL